MPAEKRNFLVRGVSNEGKFSRVVLAHSAADAEEFTRQNIGDIALIYSVNPLSDAEEVEAAVEKSAETPAVPWFGGYGIPG